MKNEQKFYSEMKKLSDDELQQEFKQIIKDGKPYFVTKSLIIQQIQRERKQ